jgi:hypothetical protein
MTKSKKHYATKAAIRMSGKNQPKDGQKFTISNCTFNGVVWDKSNIALLQSIVDGHRAAIEGINQVTRLLDSSNVNIESMLQIGGLEKEGE